MILLYAPGASSPAPPIQLCEDDFPFTSEKAFG